ncbi:MAG: hypothetical protein OXG82_20955 [Gammaproteobacteria bacterium]|nr:hypothetical protein [Gammaproteobacteria bacterium]
MDVRTGSPLLALLVLVGCEIEMNERNGGQPDDGQPAFKPLSELPALETRTFQLEHLHSSDAMALIDPYVYRDRPRAPGTISTPADVRAISVRETPDNLDKIARMLEQFDVASTSARSYRLHFQVVTANGDEVGVRLAPVTEALRKVFRFEGYSLVGEGYVTVSAGRFDLAIGAEGSMPADQHELRVKEGQAAFYGITGKVYGDQLELGVRGPEIEHASGARSRGSIQTTLGFRPGQTLVLGSMPTPDQTVFIVVHVAESDEGEPA